jgi:bifunctional ADP-heptose synthase (sugar kinase/adenylyltransferase)/phosphoglycolate phosphatase-like HAD superfamily hydrolase
MNNKYDSSTPQQQPGVRNLTLLKVDELRSLLARIPQARVAVLGDFCLDIYWFADTARGELSVETGLKTRPVHTQRCSLGAAGNVVANLVALGCRNVATLGVLGDDPWGREQLRILKDLGVNTADMLVQTGNWDTLAYHKPHLDGREDSRFDFGNFNVLADDVADELLARCRARIAQSDVVIINEQVRQGIHSDRFRAGLVHLIAAFSKCTFLADSRHYSECFTGACLKINGHEAMRLCGKPQDLKTEVLRANALAAANTLFARFGKPVVITRGGRGLVLRDASGICEIPGIQVLGRVDTVGAGDSALAGLALGLACGAAPEVAAQLGNFVAAVTIQKVNQTGTATPEEVMAVGADCDYIYRPELAEDPRQACYHTGTEFEIVDPQTFGTRRITCAIFDHDGTISTLREGWEKVMEPVMVKAILGSKYATADEALYHRTVDRVREFIEKTTGVQTLVQMEGLVAMVREFGCVPAAEILDAKGYKKVFNDALMTTVRARVEKLQRGELSADDFAIKNAVPFLQRLHAAGVKMVLASGTDQEDVMAEARAMGYADLFTGGVYGSIGDVHHEAKRVVLDRILRDLGPAGIAGLATFGDGPVEMRESRKRGGYAVGVASDEIRRFGLNPSKRARLIRAGADLVIPDFSQLEQLLDLLGVAKKR